MVGGRWSVVGGTSFCSLGLSGRFGRLDGVPRMGAGPCGRAAERPSGGR